MLAGPAEMDDEAAVKIHNIIGRLPVLGKAAYHPRASHSQEKVEPRM